MKDRCLFDYNEIIENLLDIWEADKEVVCMKRNVSKIVALIMAVIAVAFVAFACNHPEMSFPWSNRITFGFYGIYILLMIVLMIAPVKKK